jgi:hypothetical protein
MTYIHVINLKQLHYTLISLDEFTIQIISIYKGVGKIQKYMKEDQIKSYNLIKYKKVLHCVQYLNYCMRSESDRRGSNGRYAIVFLTSF